MTSAGHRVMDAPDPLQPTAKGGDHLGVEIVRSPSLQVVEHLEPAYLMRFLEAAYHKLRPGSKIVLETINPACWFAFFSSYIRDVTHVRPLHPETLQYLVGASGFQRVSVRYSAPYPDELKLQEVPAAERKTAKDIVFNENVEKLNSLIFTYLDYAAIGERM